MTAIIVRLDVVVDAIVVIVVIIHVHHQVIIDQYRMMIIRRNRRKSQGHDFAASAYASFLAWADHGRTIIERNIRNIITIIIVVVIRHGHVNPPHSCFTTAESSPIYYYYLWVFSELLKRSQQ